MLSLHLLQHSRSVMPERGCHRRAGEGPLASGQLRRATRRILVAVCTMLAAENNAASRRITRILEELPCPEIGQQILYLARLKLHRFGTGRSHFGSMIPHGCRNLRERLT